MNTVRRALFWQAGAIVLLCGCSTEAGISNSGEKFGAIDEAASITLAGTEPFWAIEIEQSDQGATARYSDPENADGSAFAVERFDGNNGLGFSGELDQANVQIALTPGDCSDGMSDRIYPYTATVAFGDSTLFGCGYTSEEPFEGNESP